MELMTEASLLTVECCASHAGGVTPVTAATHQQVQSDQVEACDHTGTSGSGSDVMCISGSHPLCVSNITLNF